MLLGTPRAVDPGRGGRPVRQPPAHRGRTRGGQDGAGPGAGRRRSASSCRGSRATPTCSPPTSPGSPCSPPTPAPGSSGPDRCSGTSSCWTSSTGRRRGPSRPCSRPWRSNRSRWTASRGRCPAPTWSSARRTRSGQLGTYPLVESQLDRFGLSTSIGYPDAEVETRLVLHSGGRYALDALVPVADTVRWHRAIGATAAVQVVNAVAEYAVALVRATRSTGTVRLGASPRAAISLIRSAQAYAVLNGRGYITPQDVQAVAVACLSHRLVAEGGSGEGPALVARVISDTPVPPT